MLLRSAHHLLVLQFDTIRADEPLLLKSDGINNQSDAVRLVKEGQLRPTVRPTEEDAQIGVAVIPAEDGISVSQCTGTLPDTWVHPKRNASPVKVNASCKIRDVDDKIILAAQTLVNRAEQEAAHLDTLLLKVCQNTGHDGIGHEHVWPPAAERHGAGTRESESADEVLDRTANKVGLLIGPCDHVRASKDCWQRGHLTWPRLPVDRESLLPQWVQETTTLAGSLVIFVQLIFISGGAFVRSAVSVGKA